MKLSKQSKKALSMLADRIEKEITSQTVHMMTVGLQANYALALRVQARIEVAQSIVGKLRAASKNGVLL